MRMYEFLMILFHLFFLFHWNSDSKTLNENQRDKLLKEMLNKCDWISAVVHVISPVYITEKMLDMWVYYPVISIWFHFVWMMFERSVVLIVIHKRRSVICDSTLGNVSFNILVIRSGKKLVNANWSPLKVHYLPCVRPSAT